MKAVYSIGVPIKDGHGIGYIAQMSIDALSNMDSLAQAYSLDNIHLKGMDTVTKSIVFDGLAAQDIDNFDAFLGWASMCYCQLLKANKIGATTFIPGSSTHPQDQELVMLKEFKKFGMRELPTNPILMARMLKEFKDVDYILASSEQVASSFSSHGLGDKLELVEFGVDTNKFKHEPIEHEGFNVVFVGENWIRKGIYYLVKAWHGLKLKDAKLIICPNAPVFSGIDYTNIVSTGFTIDTSSLYNSADLFVFPSLEEGKALVVGEAMACGIPVVVTPESGWTIEDGREGITVQIKRIKQLKDAIQYFYDNPSEEKRMGKAARKYAEEHTWAKYQKELVRVMADKSLYDDGGNIIYGKS